MHITNDRRRKPRVRLGGSALVIDGRTTHSCACIDLAATGLGVHSPSKLRKHRRVTVTFAVHDRPITVQAIVARCRGDGQKWHVGLRLIALDPATQHVLETFIVETMRRDVGHYQAQVFLARAGASSLDDVLGTKNAFAAATSDLPSAALPAFAAFDPANAPMPVMTAQQDTALGRAVVSALDEMQSEITKGGTVIAKNPLLAMRGGTMKMPIIALDDAPTQLYETFAPPRPLSATPPSPFGAAPVEPDAPRIVVARKRLPAQEAITVITEPGSTRSPTIPIAEPDTEPGIVAASATPPPHPSDVLPPSPFARRGTPPSPFASAGASTPDTGSPRASRAIPQRKTLHDLDLNDDDRPHEAAADAPDEEFTRQYGQALSKLNLDNR